MSLLRDMNDKKERVKMNCFDAALLMLKQGFECIPVDGNKRPILRFRNLRIDEAFIYENQQYYKKANGLGLLTRGVWCIDIDKGHCLSDGYKSLLELPISEELDRNALKTWVQSTPSGGMHIIFKKQVGIEYQQKIAYLTGVDIKANDNNYFLLHGSRTKKGVYQANGQKPQFYDGSLEKRIFGEKGNYEQQALANYGAKKVMHDYDFSHLNRPGKGLGREAYERIAEGISDARNNDLFLAVSYAKSCGVSIEPLTVLIGTVKNGDEFTEEEFYRTVESAKGISRTIEY